MCITSSHSTDSNHFKTNTRLLRIIVNLDFQLFFDFLLHTVQRCIREITRRTRLVPSLPLTGQRRQTRESDTYEKSYEIQTTFLCRRIKKPSLHLFYLFKRKTYLNVQKLHINLHITTQRERI